MMTDDFKNILLQLKKDCKQIESTLSDLQDDKEFGKCEAELIDHVDTVMDDIGSLEEMITNLLR